MRPLRSHVLRSVAVSGVRALLFFALPCTLAAQDIPSPPPSVDYAVVRGQVCAADQLILRPRADKLKSERRRLRGLASVGSLKALETRLGLPADVTLELSRDKRGEKRMLKAAERSTVQVDSAPFLRLKLNGKISVEEALKKLEGHPWLESAEVDGVGQGGFLPNDTYFFAPYNWHLLKTGMPAVWDKTRGSAAVTVAVLDTGLNASMPELNGRVVGWKDIVSNQPTPYDDHGHGSTVTSIMAANGNNGSGIAGLDWNCKILPIKVLNSSNSGLYSQWAEGIYYAISQGAKVINLSAGGTGTNAALNDAITAANNAGAVVVTITHNNGTGTITFPGNNTRCITVGASSSVDLRWPFSNYGSQIDLVAPGEGLIGLNRLGNVVGNLSGTSYAAPQVAAAAALMLACNPDLTPVEIENILSATTDDLGAIGWDQFYGYGRLSVDNAIAAVQARPVISQVSAGEAIRVSFRGPSTTRVWQLMESTDPSGPWLSSSATLRASSTAGEYYYDVPTYKMAAGQKVYDATKFVKLQYTKPAQ